MPDFIHDDAQLRALEEITILLGEVKAINTLISAKKPYVLHAGKRQSVTVDADLCKRVTSILEGQRYRRVKEIRSKAGKYHISLTEDEQQMISVQATDIDQIIQPEKATTVE